MEIVLLLLYTLHLLEIVICQICNRNITASQEEMTSLTTPGYNGGSGTYSSNLDCYWLLDAGADDLKLLLFVTHDTSCPNDKFSIYDGSNDTATSLASNRCGKATATHYSTTQRYAYIKMTSDATLEKAGLLIEYLASKDHSGTGCTAQQFLNATTDFQYLSSPGFPGEYASDSNCRWNINNLLGTVEIDVILSDIEADNPANCDYDKYEIFDGEYKCEHNNVRKVCQEYPSVPAYNYTSNGTSVSVAFICDSSVNRRGFLLRYRAIIAETTTTSGTTTETDTTTEESSSTESETTTYMCSTKSQYVTTTKSSGLEMNLEMLLGFIGGALLLICFTVITVVCIVTKAKPPSAKNITTVQPFKPYETVNKNSVRVRKPSKIPKQVSLQSGAKQNVPPW